MNIVRFPVAASQRCTNIRNGASQYTEPSYQTVALVLQAHGLPAPPIDATSEELRAWLEDAPKLAEIRNDINTTFTKE